MTDGDTLADGVEDINHNGKVDPHESNPRYRDWMAMASMTARGPEPVMAYETFDGRVDPIHGRLMEIHLSMASEDANQKWPFDRLAAKQTPRDRHRPGRSPRR